MKSGVRLLATIGLFAQLISAQKPATPTVDHAPDIPPPARGPSLDVSLEMSRAAIAGCQAKGFGTTVSVVDSASEIKLVVASDGPHGIIATSLKKAATAVHFGMSGAELEEKLKTDKKLADEISANPAYNAHAGSILMTVDNKIIGAIAITGAPHDIGEACLKAAFDEYKNQLR
jgi:uncharacterized protein GlcG (DUF336 family)